MVAGSSLNASLLPGLVLVVPRARWLLAPIPKVASTLLKRLAVIADGREPLAIAAFGETRPALVIHRPDVHGLQFWEQQPLADQDHWLGDPHSLRLAVTRHPGERLLSFWHDKLHLAEPAYAPLNASVQAGRGRDPAQPCRFADFLLYLGQHWEQLRTDGHLRPQREWLGDGNLFNHVVDRSQLVKALPRFLAPLLDPARMERIRQELMLYDQQHRQRLNKRWQESYGKEGFALLEQFYGDDLSDYDYQLPSRRSDRVRPLASLDGDALVDPLQQLRDRHQQIAGLQVQIQDLQRQLAEAVRPPLPSIEPPIGQWPDHNTPESGLAATYIAIGEGRPQEVLDQVAALSGHPNLGELAYLKGLAHAALDQHEQALRSFEDAQSSGFLTPYVLFNGGNSCRALGHLEDGLRLYREALEVFPGFSECRHNLALALLDVKNLQEAERELRLLLRDQPSYYQAAFCLGNFLRDEYRQREAIEAFRLCLHFAPTYPDAWNNLGLAQASIEDGEAAMASYRQALTIFAGFKPARQNLAQSLVQAKRHEEALLEFERFSSLDLSSGEGVVALQGQINCLTELDRYDDALAIADAHPDRRLQLMSRLHVLPIIYSDDQHLHAVRQRWIDDATELYGLLDGLTQQDSAWDALYAHAWALTNFYIAYQMGDDRPLQELYAGILDRILRPRLDYFMQPLPQRDPADLRPLRVGVISPHLNNHNGSIWCLGWLEGIAGNPCYEIFSYNIADNQDSGTQRFASLGTYRHLPLQSAEPEPTLQQILDDQLDLLIFTDIGMHPASKITSVLQLAPIQAQGWGHPITSGSNTMHYYFSGAGMEPEGNEAHYTETLYRLPQTGLNYETPVAVHNGDQLFDQFDLPMDRPILTSMQSTFKYVPSNDWTFAEISLRYPQALIVLVGHMGHGGLAMRLFERLRPHFEKRGLQIEQHVRALPRLAYGDYMGIFSIAHHTIDTIDWNGGNSSFQSFSLDCPVVTYPTEFMRGRHTVAMLEVLDIPELIAKDRSDYVAISVKLLEDKDFYLDIKQRIRERKERLFHDKSVARAFQAAVDSICNQPPKVGQHPASIFSISGPLNPIKPDQVVSSSV
jgi:predicted O-linked N-acetylglucosamine transferase (SPINDLY family)